jgi:autotransporter-associated beta strand protein
MVAILLCGPPVARAATYAWAVSSGDWSVAGNWGGTLPTSSDNAFIINGGTATISLPGAACNNFYLGDSNSTKTGTVQMSAGSLSTIQSESLGNAGAGMFSQSGGTNTAGNNLFLGVDAGSSGYYDLSGSGLLNGWWEYVGESGSGTFTQSGGTNQVSRALYLGYLAAGSSGSYNLDGPGLVVASTEYVGCTGAGSFTQSAGTNSAASLVLGRWAGGSGTYNLSGGMLTLKSLSGGSGTAAFDFSGGTLQAGAVLSTAMPMTFGTSGGNATFDTAGYDLTLSGPLSGPGNLVKTGAGTLALSAANTYNGSTLAGSGTLALGNAAALAESTLDTSGGGTLSFGSLTSATLGGLTGPGTLDLPGSFTLSVGNNNGSATFSGTVQGAGGLVKTGSGTLIFTGQNTYTGGTTVGAGEVQLGPSGSISGQVTVSGGTLDLGGQPVSFAGVTLSNGTILDGTLTGTPCTFQAGTVSVILAGSTSLTQTGSGTVTLTAASTYTGGTTISGGTLCVGNGGGGASIGGTSGVLDNGSLVFNHSDAVAFAPAIDGSGSLTQTGPGVLTLLGSNTYSGGTTISGGTLQVGNGGASGNIVGSVTNNAALAFNRSDNYTPTCTIAGTGQVIQAGPGTLTLIGTISNPVFANAGRIVVGPTGMLYGDLTIGTGARVENDATALQIRNFTNSGTFLGSADLSGNFINQSSGDVRIAGGQRVYVQGTSTQTNLGLVEVLGTPAAPAQFESTGPLVNASGGHSMFADQNATLYFDGGVTNQGSMAFTYGISNVFGNVTNSGGTITIAGSAGVTFYGNVVQNGTLNVGAGSSVVFLAPYSGNGAIITAGPVFFMGDASVDVNGGQLVLSNANTYSGGTSVNGGVLVAENVSAIPGGSLVSIGADGSVVLGSPGATELGLLAGGAGPLARQSGGDAAVVPAAGGVDAVPEPSTLALLGAGALGLAALACRRRRQFPRGSALMGGRPAFTARRRRYSTRPPRG